VNLERRGGRWK